MTYPHLNELQISQDEINSIEGFNLDLLKEAMRQVELKANDEHTRKERIDTRAYSLLPVLLGLIGVIFGAINLDYIQHTIMLFISSITGVLVVISTMFLLQVLKGTTYRY